MNLKLTPWRTDGKQTIRMIKEFPSTSRNKDNKLLNAMHISSLQYSIHNVIKTNVIDFVWGCRTNCGRTTRFFQHKRNGIVFELFFFSFLGRIVDCYRGRKLGDWNRWKKKQMMQWNVRVNNNKKKKKRNKLAVCIGARNVIFFIITSDVGL